ncbi:hypothetical protein FBUS_07667 [Fasciolopsis buskii]|uniref:Uncharacterized protein n=1 Tax=Fasciolopsis buskii TaxID=27845 RepID=A0A8E0RRN6_9TREM|nr:hypothetical protein FBUS_07667 [Fasciolopsis buski]
MDDVFDLVASAESSELVVGSRDWKGRLHEVSLFAVRDGLHDAHEKFMQSSFNSGVRNGFAATRRIAFLKGKLSARIALGSESQKEMDQLKNSLNSFEKRLVAALTIFSRGSRQCDIRVFQEADEFITEAEDVIKRIKRN